MQSVQQRTEKIKMKQSTIVYIVLTVLTLIGGNIFLIETHESADQQILSFYGIESRRIQGNTWDENREMVAIAGVEPQGQAKEGEQQSLAALRALNDIIGYQIIAIYNLLAALIIFATILLKGELVQS